MTNVPTSPSAASASRNANRSANRLRPISWWTVAVFLMALLVCGTIAWLHFHELETVNATVAHLDSFRQAQLDLSKGFIRVVLSPNENTPFDREQGLALLNQAFASFEQQVIQLGLPEAEIAKFSDDLNAFQSIVNSLPDRQVDPQAWVALWLTFDQLERQTESLDRATLASLNHQTDLLGNVFLLTLITAAVLFTGIGFGVYRSEQGRYQAETKQQQSEAHYRSVVEDQTELICRYDADLKLTFVNRAYAQTYGMQPDEMLGLSFLDRIPPEDRASAKAYVQALTPQHPVASSEHRSILTDGAVRWVQWTDRAVLDDAGTIVEYQGVGRDVTDHKLAEAALQDSEQRLRLFVEHAPAAIAMLDQNLCYVLVSQRWLADYGLKEVDVVGRSHYEIFPDLPESWKEIHQRCLQGAVERSEADPFPRADGTLDWVRWEIRPWRNVKDEIGGIFIFSEVITQRKQAEDNIRKLNRTLSVLSDVNQTIVRTRSISVLFEEVCQIAVDKGGYQMAWIGLIDASGQVLRPVAQAGVVGDYLERAEIKRENLQYRQKAAVDAMNAGEHIVVNDIEHDQRMGDLREKALQLGYRASAVFPLRVAGEIRGVIMLYSTERDFFDAAELRLLDEMAGDIAFALEFNEQEEARQRAEAELRASEEKYRSLIDSSDAAISMFDAEGVMVYANPIAAEAVALTPETAAGRHMSELFPPAAAQAQLAGVQQVIQSGVGKVEEVLTPVYGGEVRWYRTSVQPVRSASGSTTVALVNAVDISSLKQAEAALRESHNLLERRIAERTADLQAEKARVEAILNNSPDGILLIHPDLTIQQANASFDKIFGYDPDETFSASLLTLIHPDDGAGVAAMIQATIDEQQEKRIEVRGLRKAGSTFEAELSAGLIKGEGLVCLVRDISERKAQERQLRYQATLQQNVSDAVIVTDLQLHIQSWNAAAERIYGWTAQEAIGRNSAELLQSELTPEERAEGFRQLQEDSWWQREVTQHHKDGSPRTILGSITLIKDENGAPFGIVAVNRDITQRKQVEEALLKSAAEIHDLYNNAPGGYHSLDKDGVIVQINDTELRWLGYSRDEVVGKLKISDLFTPESVAIFRDNYPTFIKQGWINDLEFDIIRKDGSIMHVLLSGTAIYDEDGQYVKSRTTLFDITELRRAQQAITESEARYRLLAENIADVIMTFNMDRQITYMSPSCEKLLGYRPEEVVGTSHSEYIHPEDYPGVLARTRQAVVANEGSYTNQFRLRHKAGHYIWYEVRTRLVLEPETGKVEQFASVLRDITERKAAEEALRASEERLRAIVEHIPVMIGFFDSEGHFEYVNQHWIDQVGWTVEDLNTAEDSLSLFYPDAAYRQQVFEYMLATETGWRDFTCQTKHRGERVATWTNVRLSDGRSIGFGQDITDRRRAEEALRQSEERLQLFIQSAPIATLVTDKQGDIILFNHEAELVFGYQQAELIGKPVEELIPPDLRETHNGYRSQYLAGSIERRTHAVEAPALRNDGTQFPADIQLSYVDLYDEPLVLASIVDVTERKQAEAALKQALAKEKELGDLKTRFVSMASHEFRTPLATILALVETLSAYRDKLSEDQIDQRFDKIKNQIGHLKDIMEDVLMLARMQSRRVEFSPTRVDLDGLSRSLLDEFQSLPEIRSRLTFNSNVAGWQVMLDRKLMRQIIVNLVSNAIKYSPEGKAVEVGLDCTNAEVVLKVSDHGIGIPEADLAHLFEPFHRATNVGAISGTGLGLVITKEAVDLHGGTIEVESQVDFGTTFVVRIPTSAGESRDKRENLGD